VLNTNNSLITQELDEVEYNTWNPVEGSRQFLPPTPTNVKVNGSYDPSVLRGDASLTWNHRNHGDDFKSESPKHFLSLDGTTDGNTYRVLFYFDGSETEAKSDTTTGLSYTYSSVDMISDNGGVEPLTVRVVIEGLDTGNNNTSWQRYEYVMSYGDNIPGDGWNTDWSNNWDN
jgi:hypothetical protein